MPDEIVLPEGKSAYAVTRGKDWYLVVTQDDEVLVYDGSTQELRQTIKIDTPD